MPTLFARCGLQIGVFVLVKSSGDFHTYFLVANRNRLPNRATSTVAILPHIHITFLIPSDAEVTMSTRQNFPRSFLLCALVQCFNPHLFVPHFPPKLDVSRDGPR